MLNYLWNKFEIYNGIFCTEKLAKLLSGFNHILLIKSETLVYIKSIFITFVAINIAKS